MGGESNLKNLIRGMKPKLHSVEYVFTSQPTLKNIPLTSITGLFKENEGTTLIMEKSEADALGLPYEYVASMITLTIHSSLDAVGLTAVFSSELAKHGISCNVIAAYYHDHIFVNKNDGQRATRILSDLAQNYE